MSSLRETQAFFAVRASGWEERFPEDGPAYQQAVWELAPAAGARILDAGCGTGRALPLLRAAAGPTGHVVGLDITPEMLAEARRLGRQEAASLVRADGGQLPFGDGSFHAVFAAGFLPHLETAEGGLAELARITAPGGRLAIFHPIGRATLAARHGASYSDAGATSPKRLPGLLAEAGWQLESIDDADHRYLALATRC